MKRARRVVVGMSGGVDSSVAAALLCREGWDVIGATMLVWSPPGVDMGHSGSCCGLDAAEDARRVCAALGIRHYTLDFRAVFYDAIVRNYVDEYRAGRTPNPCVRCNEFIKFRALLDRARALDAEYVATGHYARVHRAACGRWKLLRGVDRRKDQSYALYRLSQEQLSRSLFPLGGLEKSRVRELAAGLSLPTAAKPDSQETCFVPNNDYPALLKILVPEALRPGPIRSEDGRLLGTHPGVAYYTIGQRRRLNVGSPVPLYVSRIDPDTDTVTVAAGGDACLLLREVTASDVNLVSLDPPPAEQPVTLAASARIRYNATDQPGALTIEQEAGGLRLRMRFAEPVRAAAPGQSLVCYSGEELLAGGIITG